MPTERRRRDPEVTSRIMAAVSSQGSKAETLLGKSMWDLGLRYRKHPRSIVGKPDHAFLGLKIAVFCDGDFWHGKGWEERGFDNWEEQFHGLRNAEFWRDKIARNMERDRQVNLELQGRGWLVVRFPESQILREPARCAQVVLEVVHSRRSGPQGSSSNS